MESADGESIQRGVVNKAVMIQLRISASFEVNRSQDLAESGAAGAHKR
jgi:hypothetical protein